MVVRTGSGLSLQLCWVKKSSSLVDSPKPAALLLDSIWRSLSLSSVLLGLLQPSGRTRHHHSTVAARRCSQGAPRLVESPHQARSTCALPMEVMSQSSRKQRCGMTVVVVRRHFTSTVRMRGLVGSVQTNTQLVEVVGEVASGKVVRTTSVKTDCAPSRIC